MTIRPFFQSPNIAGRTALLVAMLSLASTPLCSQDRSEPIEWNRFRGPNGSGIGGQTKAPLEWSNDKNVRWKTPLPGKGRSSPIVSGKRVFLTCHSAVANGIHGFSKSLLCIDLQNGQILWEKQIARRNPKAGEKYSPAMHGGFAPHTPVAEDNQVYAYFGVDGLYAFDSNGNQIWHVATGAGEGTHGTGSSPIVHGDSVFINAGVECGELLAVKKRTGKIKWRVKDDRLKTTLSTPIVAPSTDGDQLLVHMNGNVASFAVESGDLLWDFESPKTVHVQITSPVLSEGTLVCCPSYANDMFALSVNGAREAGELLWGANVNILVTTPLVTTNKILLSDKGITQFIDSKSGDDIAQVRSKRKKGRKKPKSFSSPVQINDHWVAINSIGESYVWALTPQAAEPIGELRVNALKEEDPFFAGTPAVTKNEILIRSDQYLYCIATILTRR